MILENKVAIVTGGSRGIGKEIALSMAREGADIAIIYGGNKVKAEETIKEIESLGRKARAYDCNVSDFNIVQETVKSIIADFEKIDILVNNAGITKDALIMTMKPEDFRDVIDINLNGIFYMTKQVTAHMMRKKTGSIVNISSISGMMGNAGQANYVAAKAGVIGLTKTTAKEFASRNIRCNAIAPGFIATDMTEKLTDNIKNGVAEAVPLKRMGNTIEVANLAVFLASDKASYITGETIKVDGGLYI